MCLLSGEQTPYFRGSRIKTKADKRADHRRQINRQLKAAVPRRDQHRSEKTRSKDKSRETRTAPRRNVRGSEHFVKSNCSDDL
jgi:hypothetical protein